MRCAPGVTVPTLFIELTGDQTAFPADSHQMIDALGAKDLTTATVRGLPFGGAIGQGEPTSWPPPRSSPGCSNGTNSSASLTGARRPRGRCDQATSPIRVSVLKQGRGPVFRNDMNSLSCRFVSVTESPISGRIWSKPTWLTSAGDVHEPALGSKSE
jgi:hypothetical protein